MNTATKSSTMEKQAARLYSSWCALVSGCDQKQLGFGLVIPATASVNTRHANPEARA
jgi:hypothetical protein